MGVVPFRPPAAAPPGMSTTAPVSPDVAALANARVPQMGVVPFRPTAPPTSVPSAAPAPVVAPVTETAAPVLENQLKTSLASPPIAPRKITQGMTVQEMGDELHRALHEWRTINKMSPGQMATGLRDVYGIPLSGAKKLVDIMLRGGK